MKPKIVIDTNIIISALRSQNGAANKLLRLLGTQKFIPNISVPLVLEYEEVIKRLNPKFTPNQINDFLDYICAASKKTEIFFLWRPLLKDIADDMVLEVAVSSQSNYIVTYNIKDFTEAYQFGIKLITPRKLLALLGELS